MLYNEKFIARILVYIIQARIQDYKLGGRGYLKKIAPNRARCEKFGVFRVKNHGFTEKKHIFSNLEGGGGGGGAGCAPPLRLDPRLLPLAIY